jgi:hypothetical protein
VATAALPFTAANLEQQLVTGLVSGTGYALVAVGFGLIITVTGRFHIAYGATYALSAFVAGQVGCPGDCPSPPRWCSVSSSRPEWPPSWKVSSTGRSTAFPSSTAPPRQPRHSRRPGRS